MSLKGTQLLFWVFYMLGAFSRIFMDPGYSLLIYFQIREVDYLYISERNVTKICCKLILFSCECVCSVAMSISSAQAMA